MLIINGTKLGILNEKSLEVIQDFHSSRNFLRI